VWVALPGWQQARVVATKMGLSGRIRCLGGSAGVIPSERFLVCALVGYRLGASKADLMHAAHREGGFLGQRALLGPDVAAEPTIRSLLVTHDHTGSRR